MVRGKECMNGMCEVCVCGSEAKRWKRVVCVVW